MWIVLELYPNSKLSFYLRRNILILLLNLTSYFNLLLPKYFFLTYIQLTRCFHSSIILFLYLWNTPKVSSFWILSYFHYLFIVSDKKFSYLWFYIFDPAFKKDFPFILIWKPFRIDVFVVLLIQILFLTTTEGYVFFICFHELYFKTRV